MCLLNFNYLPSISKNEITVYKIVLEKNGEFITPFMYHKVDTSIIQKANINSIINFWGERLCNKMVSQGFIHAFTSIERAKEEVERLKWMLMLPSCENIISYECIIPKYTFYYLGAGEEIATRRLKYIKQIKL